MIKYGVVMAGGLGKRLSPLTDTISKHLLSIYDKPMIYYPISVLMLMKIRNILIICDQKDLKNYKMIFGDGSKLGIDIKYKLQKKPTGIPEGVVLSRKFVKKENFVLILGDNFFYNNNCLNILHKHAANFKSGCQIFTTEEKETHLYGVLIKRNNRLHFQEKVKTFNKNKVIVGLYFFDHTALDKYRKIDPSLRNETEILDLINLYNVENNVAHFHLGKNVKWYDLGSFDKILEASSLIKKIQNNNKILIAYVEKIAFDNCWITKSHFKKLIKNKISTYYNNLRKLNISSGRLEL